MMAKGKTADTAAAAVELDLTKVEVAAEGEMKVTTIRLTQSEYNQAQLFCQAMDNMSLTEFAGRAIRAYMVACSKDEKLRAEVKRQINKQRRALDQFAKAVLGDDAE